MKKLIAAMLAALMLAGCVAPKAPETTAPTTKAAVDAPVIPSPQEMPEKPPENTLPPGEDNIPQETYTH